MINTDPTTQFLQGGGEMGALMRSKDWSQTVVGDPAGWPQSLRTTLSILLNSKFPMFLWWGPDLTCFYNDAYRPSLGKTGKHPSILGMAAVEAWPEIWTIIKPLIDQVLSGGDSTWSEDQLIPIYRNGKMEDVYWTFSYSPVNDESGMPAGVFVTCTETTEKVKTLEAIRNREDQLRFTIQAAELGTWDLDPTTKNFMGNERIKEWFGVKPEAEIPLQLALDNIEEHDRQKVVTAIERALQPGSDGHYEIDYSIIHPENGEERRVLAKGRALFNEQHVPYRFSGILQDITQHISARKKVEESEKRFRQTVKQAPLGIIILRGSEFIVELVNENYLEIVSRKEQDMVGRTLFDSMPEVRASVEPLLTAVLTSGIPYYGTEFPVTIHRFGKDEITYFNFVYHPLKEETGEITGIITVAMEVTASVKARHSLAESEKQFRNLVMQSPIPMTIWRGPEYVIEVANKVMIEKIWRKKQEDLIGKKALDVFPELRDQKYPELLQKVYSTAQSHQENESIAYVQGDDGLKKFYLDFEYAPLFETDGKVNGIIITVNDVTEKVDARQKVEVAETRMRLATEAAELATWDLDLQTGLNFHSPRLAEIFGYDPATRLDHLSIRKQVHPDDLEQVVEKALENAMKTGIYKYEARIIKTNNELRWIRTQGRVIYDESDRAVKMIGTLRDITEEKQQQQELLESEQKFRLLADSMPQHIWTADTEGNLNYYNKSVFDYSGLNSDDFNRNGWIQIVHPDDREENIRRWTHAVTNGTDFLLEHRFRRKDGEYRWQLSRAIPQRDAAGNIQMWVGTSTDIQDQKTFTDKLESLVIERTSELQQKNKELEKMNAELQSFAYVSSHDLQEPLRKIQTFATRIMEKELANLSEKGKDYFQRMQSAANRMQTLIQDLLAYSRTNDSDNIFEYTDLTNIVTEVKNEFRELITEKNGSMEIGNMCKVNIIPFQFRQLLHNLVSNSLKFSRPGIAPHIFINTTIVKGSELPMAGAIPQKNYCHLSVNDNGIGFDPQYKERIFEVFQRLHGKEEYKGTGIGLAIVKKIVENHSGFIEARSEPGQGASFDIYLPVS